PGGWSTERLADALRVGGPEAAVVDLVACGLRPPDGAPVHAGQPVPRLDGGAVTKLGVRADGPAAPERANVVRRLRGSGTAGMAPFTCNASSSIPGAISAWRCSTAATSALTGGWPASTRG